MPEEEEVLIFEELSTYPSTNPFPKHVPITSGLGAAEVLRRFGGLKGWIVTENRWYGDTMVIPM